MATMMRKEELLPVDLHTAALCLRRRIEMDLFGDVSPEEGPAMATGMPRRVPSRITTPAGR